MRALRREESSGIDTIHRLGLETRNARAAIETTVSVESPSVLPEASRVLYGHCLARVGRPAYVGALLGGAASRPGPEASTGNEGGYRAEVPPGPGSFAVGPSNLSRNPLAIEERHHTVRKYLLGLLVVVVLAVGVVLVGVYSGAYNVAATVPHFAATDWLLETAMERSVAARARRVKVPDLSSAARIRRGAGAYGELCVTCHGAPGVDPSDIGRGLAPTPPSLQKTASDWSAQELYWIVDHGVKFTGMPAFGPTQNEERLWDIVALVQKLPRLSADEYRNLKTP